MVVSFKLFAAGSSCFFGRREEAPFFQSSLSVSVCFSYSAVITTKMRNVEFKILQITVLSKYVLNPNMKIRILLHTT